MERIYTADDSREVRQTYLDALKKQKKKDTRKFLVTKKEWAKLVKSGAKMDRYEIYEEFQKRLRKQASDKYKANLKTTGNLENM